MSALKDVRWCRWTLTIVCRELHIESGKQHAQSDEEWREEAKTADLMGANPVLFDWDLKMEAVH